MIIRQLSLLLHCFQVTREAQYFNLNGLHRQSLLDLALPPHSNASTYFVMMSFNCLAAAAANNTIQHTVN